MLSWLFKKERAGYIVIGLALAAGLIWYFALSGESAGSQTALYFLNVGQGDSQLIQLKNGAQILIDAGPSGTALLENLAKILPPQDRYIDILLMTHPQLDHFSGFIDVLKNYKIGAFIASGRKADVEAYPELHKQLEAQKISYVQLAEGDLIEIGEARLQVLSPSPGELMSGELNDTGLVILLTTPEFKALYTADIDADVEARLVKMYDVDVDILKVAHHGSRFSTSEQFLKEATPKIAVIGVGKNSYGHPTAQVFDRLAKFTDKVYRTDKDGIIKVVFDSGSFIITNVR